MPDKKPTKTKWKAKYKGKWYDVLDVEDMGAGKQNVYHLDQVGPVEKIEDLDMVTSTCKETGMFHERLMDKYQITAADVVKFSGEWKGTKNKKGKSQRSLKEVKKQAENIVKLIPKAIEEDDTTTVEPRGGTRLERIRESMNQINRLMLELREMPPEDKKKKSNLKPVKKMR